MRFFRFVKAPLVICLLRVGLVILIAGGIQLSGAAEPFLRNFDTRQLVAVLVVQPLILIGLVLQGVRHAVLIDQPGLSNLMATKAVALSQGLNLLLPARLSEVLKATYLRKRANVPFSAGISAVVLERTVDLIIVGAMGFVCLFFFTAVISKTLVFLVVVLTVVLLSTAIWGGGSIRALTRILPWPRISSFIEQAYLHFAATLTSPAFFLGLGLGLFVWGVSFLNYFLFLSIAGEVQVGVYGALLVFVFTTVGGAVPALPGGLGTYEAAAVFALMSLGYTFPDALALAVTLHAAQLSLPIGLALIIMLTDQLGLTSLIAELRTSARRSKEG